MMDGKTGGIHVYDHKIIHACSVFYATNYFKIVLCFLTG